MSFLASRSGKFWADLRIDKPGNGHHLRDWNSHPDEWPRLWLYVQIVPVVKKPTTKYALPNDVSLSNSWTSRAYSLFFIRSLKVFSGFFSVSLDFVALHGDTVPRFRSNVNIWKGRQSSANSAFVNCLKKISSILIDLCRRNEQHTSVGRLALPFRWAQVIFVLKGKEGPADIRHLVITHFSPHRPLSGRIVGWAARRHTLTLFTLRRPSW